MNDYGVHAISADLLDLILDAKKYDEWKIFQLPDSLSTKEEFMTAAHELLPFDPPFFSDSDSWDALSDSLWGGLHALHAIGVLIIWPHSKKLSLLDPITYRQIISIFESISKTIRNPQYGGGWTTNLLVLLVESGL